MRKLFGMFLVFFLFGISLQAQKQRTQQITVKPAPDTITVEFQTTKGNFLVEAYRKWSPKAVDRFCFLVKGGFYDSLALFRVQSDYVVQFGIADKPSENSYWEAHPLPDEPVIGSNRKGTIAYARGGKNSRTTQLFINYQDNYKLDTTNFNGLRGFPPFGQVIEGMKVVERFYGGYGFEPATKQDSIYDQGNAFLERAYPKLDYILNAQILKEQQ